MMLFALSLPPKHEKHGKQRAVFLMSRNGSVIIVESPVATSGAPGRRGYDNILAHITER